MPTTYRRTATDSDLGGGSPFNKAILEPGSDATGSDSPSVGAGASITARAFTAPGVPGVTGITGNYSVEVEVTSGNTSIQVAVQLHRVNSAGTVQSSSALSAEQQANAGTLTFTFTSLNLGTWAAGDRLRIDYRFRSTAAHGNNSITISHGGTNNEVVAPWSASSPATVTPAAIAVTTAIATPTPSIPATVTPAPISVAASIPTPSATAPEAQSFGYLDTPAPGAVGDQAEGTNQPFYSTGLLEIITCIRYPDWVVGGASQVRQIAGSGSSVTAWTFEMQNDVAGTATSMRFRWWDSGNTERTLAATPGALGNPGANNHRWLRVVWNPNNGGDATADFYVSQDPIDTDPASVTWTHINQAGLGATSSMRTGVGRRAQIGGNTGTGALPRGGEYFVVYAYYNGTRVWSPDFRDDDQGWSTEPATDDDGGTWDVAGNAKWVPANPIPPAIRATSRLPIPAAFGAVPTGYINMPGGLLDEVITPDANDLDIAGDFEVIVLVNLADSEHLAGQNLITKGDTIEATGSFMFRVVDSGFLQLKIRDSGGVERTYSATIPLAAFDSGPQWLRVVFDADDGSGNSRALYYRSDDPPDTDLGSVTWEGPNIGTIASTAVVNTSTAPVRLGNLIGATITSPQAVIGGIYAAFIYDGITLVADPDFRDGSQTTDDGVTFEDSFGHVWTPDGDAQWVAPDDGGVAVQPASITVPVTIPIPTILAAAAITPATIAATATLPTPGISAAATVTPATIVITVAIPTPTVAAAATAKPVAVAVTTSIPNPVISIPGTRAPPAIAASTTIPTPTVAVPGTAAPGAITASVTLPTPAISAGGAVTPAAISAVSTLPTPAITAAPIVTPGPVTAAVTIPTPSVSIPGVASPGAIEVDATLPTPVASAGATVTPEVVTATTALPIPTIPVADAAKPAVINAPVSLPIPTVQGVGVIAVDPVEGTATLPAPTISISGVTTPEVVEVAVTLPTPTVNVESDDATANPGVIGVVTTIPTPTITGEATATPEVINVAASIPTPSPLAGTTVTPATIAVTAALPAPSVTAPGSVTPATIAIAPTIPTPSPTVGAATTPEVIEAPVTLPTPTAQGAAVVTPAPIQASTTIPRPTISIPATVTPQLVNATISLPIPTPAITAAVTPALIAVSVTLPTPTVLGAATVSPAPILISVTFPQVNILFGDAVGPDPIAVPVTIPTPTVVALPVILDLEGGRIYSTATRTYSTTSRAYAKTRREYKP